MNLYDIIDNDRTDKNTLHSYLDLYQSLFNNKKYTAKNILEIGIYRGGSIKLWSEFFINAKIYGIDIIDIDNIYEDVKNNVNITLWNYFIINLLPCGIDMNNIHAIWDDIKNKQNIILYKGSDAYDYNFFNEKFLNKNIKFDVMIDDGPHTLETMIQFIKLYSQIMTDDGILIVEDVQSIDWIDELKNAVPENLQSYIKWYDLRKNKNKSDDIVFTIDKSL
jgi:hypothetical protein